jgi:1,4-dihydroxy-2-naphthoate octaprenyltransferase
VAGIILIAVGAFGIYNNWGRFNSGLKSAEKMAPIFTSGATLILGVIILFWNLDFWFLILGLILFGIGYLLRGPASARYR